MNIEWIDRTTSWIPLKDVKSADPLKTVEYTLTYNIDHDPAFAWWVSHTIRTWERAVSKCEAAKITKGSKTFEIQVINTIVESENLDLINKNYYWKEVIKRRLNEVWIAFQLVGDTCQIPTASKETKYHFIFDLKMDLTRKVFFVVGVHLNKNVPKHSSYSSVVSRKNARIRFTLATLNSQQIITRDIRNAYLNAKPLETCDIEVRDDYSW